MCPHGEGRVYTTPKVIDVKRYFYKAEIFDGNGYDDEHRRLWRDFMPGFDLLDIVGGPVKVVGVVNRTGSMEDIEDMATKRDKSHYFFLHVLVEAINTLPEKTRTRAHNLALQSAHCKVLPSYFRIYMEDIDALSTAIITAQRALPPNAPYRFYFEFGQQLRISHPISIDSVGLSCIIYKPQKVQSCCLHIATTFTHTSPTFSTFWNLLASTSLYTGKDVKKYPLFGLHEVGNITVKSPTSPTHFLNAWQPHSRQNTHLTYAQFYTPLTKSFTTKPFQDHPFLLTLMLGQEYVQRNPTFRQFQMSTERDADYLALKEAILLHLDRASSRCELVVAGPDIAQLLNVNLTQLADNIKSSHLLVQVSNE